jgi:hypothetical protein
MPDLEQIPSTDTCGNCFNYSLTTDTLSTTTTADQHFDSESWTDNDDAAFDQACQELNLPTVTAAPRPLNRQEKLLLAFYKQRHDRISNQPTDRLSILPPDDEPPHTLSFVSEESDDDWDNWDDSTSSTPPTPPPPPTPPVPPSDAPGPSIPASPPSLPPGNPAITKIKQKFLTFFKKF